jgi:hypothetical protein
MTDTDDGKPITKMVDAADYQVTPGRPLPPTMPGRVVPPASYDYDGARHEALADGLGVRPEPVLTHGTYKVIERQPDGTLATVDSGIPYTISQVTGEAKPVAQTPEAVQKLIEYQDKTYQLPTAEKARRVELAAAIRESERTVDRDPFWAEHAITQGTSQVPFGTMSPDEIRGWCQYAAAKLGLQFCYCPIQTRESGAWTYAVIGRMSYGPTANLLAIAKRLEMDLNEQQSNKARAAQQAEHMRKIQGATVVKTWVGDEPVAANGVDALRAELLARLERLENAS